jgi:hypothetical protein
MIKAGTGLRSEDHAMLLPPFTGKCTQIILLPGMLIHFRNHRLAENHYPCLKGNYEQKGAVPPRKTARKM